MKRRFTKSGLPIPHKDELVYGGDSGVSKEEALSAWRSGWRQSSKARKSIEKKFRWF